MFQVSANLNDQNCTNCRLLTLGNLKNVGQDTFNLKWFFFIIVCCSIWKHCSSSLIKIESWKVGHDLVACSTNSPVLPASLLVVLFWLWLGCSNTSPVLCKQMSTHMAMYSEYDWQQFEIWLFTLYWSDDTSCMQLTKSVEVAMLYCFVNLIVEWPSPKRPA